MSGRASRQKGMRGEYLVRDHMRDLGWESNRVPLSGASYGKEDKGDVRLTKAGKTLVAEVKFRKDEYLSLYSMLTSAKGQLLCLALDQMYVVASYSFSDLWFDEEGGRSRLFEGVQKPTRTQKKLFNLHKLVKTCDFLVIKCNNYPLMFIRFWGVK